MSEQLTTIFKLVSLCSLYSLGVHFIWRLLRNAFIRNAVNNFHQKFPEPRLFSKEYSKWAKAGNRVIERTDKRFSKFIWTIYFIGLIIIGAVILWVTCS